MSGSDGKEFMGEFDFTKLAGKFIVFDGADGCGKTTQMRALIEKLEGGTVKVRRLREPGGTHIGEQIRETLLSVKNEGMDIRCEMLLYMASRAQLIQEEVRPALARGECVLADRFASSTIAYQGGGGGLSVDAILQVAEIAVDKMWPHLTIIFDLPTEAAMQRLNPMWAGGRKKGDPSQNALFEDAHVKDRIEQRAQDYFERVRDNYRWQVERWPHRYRMVDAGKSILQVERQLMQVLGEFFK